MSIIEQNKVQTRTDEKPKTFTRIDLGTMSDTQAQKIKARIEAMSYNKFEILISPVGGCVQVWAETSYKGSKDSILGSLLSIMATSI